MNQIPSMPAQAHAGPTTAAPQGHVGRAAHRVEDAALLSGRGSFADDVGVKPGTLHAAILRSPHATATCYSRLRASDDVREGVEAFHQKRKAEFNGS